MMKVRLGVWLNFRAPRPDSVMENYAQDSANILQSHAATTSAPETAWSA
jgi:hypothetical protein